MKTLPILTSAALLLAPFAVAAATVPLMQELDARRQTRREAAWLAEYPHGPSAVHDIDTDPDTLPGEPMTLTEEAADWLNTYTDDTAHAAALAKNGDLWIAALLDEIDRLTEERDDAWAAAEEEAATAARLTTILTHYQENQ